jgi:hypothetical protein
MELTATGDIPSLGRPLETPSNSPETMLKRAARTVSSQLMVTDVVSLPRLGRFKLDSDGGCPKIGTPTLACSSLGDARPNLPPLGAKRYARHCAVDSSAARSTAPELRP